MKLTRSLSVTVPVIVLPVVWAVAAPVSPGAVCGEGEVDCLCPDFYTWTVKVPIRVSDETGTLELRFTARPTHTLDHAREKGLYWAWYNPNPRYPYDPVLVNDGRRIWHAEGVWKASCRCIGGIDILRPFRPPNNFIGRTWYEDHEIEDPMPDPNPPGCDWEPCGDSGGGSGGTGGGDTGIDHPVSTYYTEYSLVCWVTDWYVCVDGWCRYQHTQIHYCWWEPRA
ncbi:MAG: hypothetical protein KatS3mg081_0843 [Gemmatimonadales bacterium]|nr:MAG: hypothetical protein KatS3mg081_0843 [Gemmatimonadales bacterium]